MIRHNDGRLWIKYQQSDPLNLFNLKTKLIKFTKRDCLKLTTKTLDEVLEDPRYQLYNISYMNTQVGFIILRQWDQDLVDTHINTPEFNLIRKGYLEIVYVCIIDRKSYRRKGIGRKIVNEIVSKYTDGRVFADIIRNELNILFWSSVGFKPIHDPKHQYLNIDRPYGGRTRLEQLENLVSKNDSQSAGILNGMADLGGLPDSDVFIHDDDDTTGGNGSGASGGNGSSGSSGGESGPRVPRGGGDSEIYSSRSGTTPATTDSVSYKCSRDIHQFVDTNFLNDSQIHFANEKFYIRRVHIDSYTSLLRWLKYLYTNNYSECFLTRTAEHDFQTRLKNDMLPGRRNRSMQFYNICSEESPIGFVIVTEKDTYLEIDYLCIAPNYRKKRIARTILSQLLLMNPKKDVLVNSVRSVESHAFWWSVGFRPKEEIELILQQFERDGKLEIGPEQIDELNRRHPAATDMFIVWARTE